MSDRFQAVLLTFFIHRNVAGEKFIVVSRSGRDSETQCLARKLIANPKTAIRPATLGRLAEAQLLVPLWWAEKSGFLVRGFTGGDLFGGDGPISGSGNGGGR